MAHSNMPTDARNVAIDPTVQYFMTRDANTSTAGDDTSALQALADALSGKLAGTQGTTSADPTVAYLQRLDQYPMDIATLGFNHQATMAIQAAIQGKVPH